MPKLTAICGRGERGPVRIKPKRLEDAEKATRLERFVTAQVNEALAEYLLWGFSPRLMMSPEELAKLYGEDD